MRRSIVRTEWPIHWPVGRRTGRSVETEILTRGAGLLARRATRGGLAVEHVRFLDVDELTVLDADRASMHFFGAAAFRVVHQRVGAVNQVGRQLSRDAAPLGNIGETQAYHADVHANRARAQPAVVARPVVLFDRLLETVRDLHRLKAAGEIGNEKTEFV